MRSQQRKSYCKIYGLGTQKNLEISDNSDEKIPFLMCENGFLFPYVKNPSICCYYANIMFRKITAACFENKTHKYFLLGKMPSTGFK
jgi:hypothetical protein